VLFASQAMNIGEDQWCAADDKPSQLAYTPQTLAGTLPRIQIISSFWRGKQPAGLPTEKTKAAPALLVPRRGRLNRQNDMKPVFPIPAEFPGPPENGENSSEGVGNWADWMPGCTILYCSLTGKTLPGATLPGLECRGGNNSEK
jgi:hypothetical protein